MHHHHGHHHHPDLEDVALGYLIGRSVGQRPPSGSGGSGGGYGWMVFIAVLVGLVDIPLVPALWNVSGEMMRQAPLMGLFGYLLALFLAAVPILIVYGMIDSYLQDRKFDAAWRRNQEKSRLELEASRLVAEQRRIEHEKQEALRREQDPQWQLLAHAQAVLNASIHASQTAPQDGSDPVE